MKFKKKKVWKGMWKGLSASSPIMLYDIPISVFIFAIVNLMLDFGYFQDLVYFVSL
jgi:hypothetical protein